MATASIKFRFMSTDPAWVASTGDTTPSTPSTTWSPLIGITPITRNITVV